MATPEKMGNGDAFALVKTTVWALQPSKFACVIVGFTLIS